MAIIDLDTLYVKFQQTGICEIHVDYVVEHWDENWKITQWGDGYDRPEEYSLIYGNKESKKTGKFRTKTTISKQQAHELIGKLDLIMKQSPVFNSGKTWVSKTTNK